MSRNKNSWAFELLPGLALTLAIASAALILRRVSALSTLSPLILAVLIGVGIRSICPLPLRFHAGVAFAGRTLLRIAVILLGFQLSAFQLIAIGWDGLFVVVVVVIATFTATIGFGTLLKVDSKLTSLVAAGTAICGASAVAAMSAVNGSEEEDVVYAVGLVTVLGTILMFMFPFAIQFIGFGPRESGIWAGASIHEVAQVTGAAFQMSEAAGEFGVIVKLTRVLFLAPLIAVVGVLIARRGGGTDRASLVPLFVIGFLTAVAFNSLIPISVEVRGQVMITASFLMSVALAALGLQTDFRRLKAKGIRPFLLGVSAMMFIASVSFGLIWVLIGHGSG